MDVSYMSYIGSVLFVLSTLKELYYCVIICSPIGIFLLKISNGFGCFQPKHPTCL